MYVCACIYKVYICMYVMCDFMTAVCKCLNYSNRYMQVCAFVILVCVCLYLVCM